MARYRITAKVPNLTTTIVGVTFVASVAELELTEDKVSTLAYFNRQGYKVEELDLPAPERPNKSGSKKDWVAYAVAQGVPAEMAEGLSRDQLAEHIDELIAAAAAESQEGEQN